MNAKNDLRPEIQEKLKGKSTNVIYINEEDKYSKERFVYVSKAYDCCANIFVVRTYIQRRYDISQRTLELLLKLMGLKLFTINDYHTTPKAFDHCRWTTFKETGYINLVMDHNKAEEQIYCLSTKARNIVISFYEHLSGEKKIPETSRYNPMAKANKDFQFDKRKMELIKKLNKLPVPDHIKYLYE